MALEGFGLGLRPQHFPDILGDDPDATAGVDWFEIISENFINVGGPPLRNMMLVRERFPMVMHGVSLSIGSTDPLDMDYLAGLKALADLVEPELISDHLCWTGVHGLNMHDLLPLPMTEETVEHVAGRVRQVQDYLGRQFMLENASTYVTFEEDEMTEWAFLSAICERADCNILLDVNNIYVSGFNHGFSTDAYLNGVPAECIKQIHLAGHEHNGDYIVDTHDEPVPDYVLALYEKAIDRFGMVPTMIERDANIPPFAELVRELQGVRRIVEERRTMVLA
ncbi:MAG: DUF692 domain-containing protein [Rhodospirillales bacterium]|nr:DUF692 domain-containing protein [Rhodospirillales bacterium]MBO6786263.1 DUF692 domain-containing protein [Rhodospirillales bacterium]